MRSPPAQQTLYLPGDVLKVLKPTPRGRTPIPSRAKSTSTPTRRPIGGFLRRSTNHSVAHGARRNRRICRHRRICRYRRRRVCGRRSRSSHRRCRRHGSPWLGGPLTTTTLALLAATKRCASQAQPPYLLTTLLPEIVSLCS